MSFGWSAGDIAQAISLIVKVVKALDDGSGAPDEYRKMAVFLENVNLTLKNLHVFATLGVAMLHPAGGKHTPKDVMDFQAFPSQTEEGNQGAFTYARQPSKSIYIMISVLEGMLNSVRGEISLIRSEGREQHKGLHPKAEEIILLLQSLKIDDSMPENNDALDAAVHNIKEHITSTLESTSNPQLPIIGSCPRRAYNTKSPSASNVLFQAMNRDPLEASDEEIKQSLRVICYSIFLYAGMLLRNLCSSCQKDILQPGVANKIEKSYAPVSQVAMEQYETKGSGLPILQLSLELPTTQPKYASELQRSKLKPDAGPSTSPTTIAEPQAHSPFTSTPPASLQTSPKMTSPKHTSPSSTRQSAGNPSNNRSVSTAATSLIRPPRYYMLRAFTNRLLPLALFAVFLITGTVILIYSVVDKRVIPSNFIAGSYITIGVIIILWCLSRFILFLRESFGELGVNEAEAGLQGVHKVHVRGLWGREEGRVKKCLRWLMETPRSDGSKSPVSGDDFGNHGSRNRREAVRQDPQVAEEGIELRDFGIPDQDSQIASSGLALPSLERLSNVSAHPFKPQNQPNDPNPDNPIPPRATSHQQTPSKTQRNPAPPPQETRNHRVPTLNPKINTSHDRLTVHHSSPPNPSQPVSYTDDESRDITSQTRLAPNILPLSMQINPGSINSVPRSRESKITRPLTQSSQF
ncbi:hypothetical protein BCON_0033g00040 [Botryotinia convoluta]|uniref:Uncharacterized protein n=1 Tax=Botryotinia convoluta TaxID=54673 RepID=A0A4Z1IMQ6_9HELO|nr:hypothetical protein BCON_0033g00040 [Botryotinia convoluta]